MVTRLDVGRIIARTAIFYCKFQSYIHIGENFKYFNRYDF